MTTQLAKESAQQTGTRPAQAAPLPEVATRRVITMTMLVIAGLAFAFSFGNIWTLARHLGVPAWIAPLVGPAVDLSVAGLLLAVRYLTLRGVEPCRLRPARLLLTFSGLATLILNIAEPMTRSAYGRAAFDAVGPLLLLGWAEVGPRLLSMLGAPSEQLASASPRGAEAASDVGEISSDSSATESDLPASESVRPAERRSNKRSVPQAKRGPADREFIEHAVEIDEAHRAEYQRPVPADTLRQELRARGLRIGSARARRLVNQLRTPIRTRITDSSHARGSTAQSTFRAPTEHQ